MPGVAPINLPRGLRSVAMPRAVSIRTSDLARLAEDARRSPRAILPHFDHGTAVAFVGRDMAARQALSSRIEIAWCEGVPTGQTCELDAFVRRCIDRIETELGRADAWIIRIAIDRSCHACHVTVRHGKHTISADSRSFDGAIAAWEALRKLEGLVRESRLSRPGTAAEVARAAR